MLLVSTLLATVSLGAATGVRVVGPQNPSGVEAFALSELRAALARLAEPRRGGLTLVIGRPDSNPEVKRLLGADYAKPETRKEGYSLKYDKAKGLVLVAGADDRGTLYGVMDLIHYRLADLVAGKLESFQSSEAPRIDYRGIWCWGGRIYNYEQFLDQMARWKMNLVIPWHKTVPRNAKAFQDYAASRGVYVAWGYTWGWPAIDWNDAETIRKTSETAVQVFKEQYAPLRPFGIYFQSHTEYGAGGGVGDKWVDLVNRTSARILEMQPDVRIFAGLHGTFSRPPHAEAIKGLDTRVDVMYEDIRSAPHYVVAPVRKSAAELNRMLASIRGTQEKIGYVYKGFTQAMGGGDPQLITDPARLRALATAKWSYWAMNEGGWRQDFAGWNDLLRDVAASQAQRKSVTLLVEGGLWEYRPWWAACLLAEATWNPERNAEALITTLDACPDAFSALRHRPEPDPSQVVRHVAVGRPVTMKTPIPGPEWRERQGPASLTGPPGLVDGLLAAAPRQEDPWMHGLAGADFEAVIDLGRALPIREVQARFLHNPGHARPAVAPATVEIAVSPDGANFTVVATPQAQPTDQKTGIRVFTAANLEVTGQYVRVRAEGTEKRWLFADEILVK